MEELSAIDAALLVGGGLVAGVINTLAGGGSLLTVPLLVLLGLPGNLANGTNRVGILLQNVTASWRFRAQGVSDRNSVLRVLAPISIGAAVGALGITQLDDVAFERVFGVAMLVLLVPLLRPRDPASDGTRRWPAWLSTLAYLGIGAYMGAIQAGAGLPLLMVLLHAGQHVVRANAIKVAVMAVATAIAVPIFAWQGQVAWIPALVLGTGYAAGGALGAQFAVTRGERVVRPLLALAVVALALRMVGVY